LSIVSVQRMITVVVSTLVLGSFILISTEYRHWSAIPWKLFDRAILTWLVITLLLFATSFSITRCAAIVTDRIQKREPYLSIVGLACLLFFQYALLCYWGNILYFTIWQTVTYYHVLSSRFLASYMPVSTMINILWISGYSQFMFILTAARRGAFIQPLGQLHAIISLFTVSNSEIQQPSSLMMRLSFLLNLIPNLTRLSLAAIFIASFLLKPFHVSIKTLWLRLIESKRPVFAMVFGGSAAIVSGITAIVKMVHAII
jgi:hypothetical protein